MKTDDNLQHVIKSAGASAMKYSAYAVIADDNGYRQVAKLFRALAETQKVHAINMLRALGELGNTQENLSAAIDGKTYEFTQLLPTFIEQADKDGNPMASTTFQAAINSTRVHVKILNTAMENLGRNKDAEYWVCGICGNLEYGDEPVACKNCGGAREKFMKVG